MKKFARMSLVAAVAVAGLTTANAKPLEEAIKGVDVTGSMVYRYDQRQNDVADSTVANNNWKIATTVKAPVNEYVTANVRIVTENGMTTNSAPLIGLDTDAGEANPSLNVSNANFTLTTSPVTAIVGKQGLATPWTVAVDSDGQEQTGTGALALGNAGPVTLAGGYFNQTNLNSAADHVSGLLDGGEDIAVAAVIVPVGSFTLDAWYLTLQDVFDTFTFGGKGSVDLDSVKLGLDTRYVALDLTEGAIEAAGRREQSENSMFKALVSADMGIFGAKLAYVKTGKHGGLTALDDDAQGTYIAWNIFANDKEDAELWHVAADVDLTSTLNLAANFATIDFDGINGAGERSDEADEYYAQLTYKMSSNLTSYLRYGKYTLEQDGAESIDQNRGRVQVAYTF